MKQNMKAFIKYLIVAVCSAIVTFLTSSCTAGLVIGKNQRQQQENNISTRADFFALRAYYHHQVKKDC